MPAGDTFPTAVWDEIIARIRLGEPLRQICRDEKMPSYGTVYDKREQDEEYAARFARARDLGFDAIAEECLEIANTPLLGETVTTGPDGTTVKQDDMLGHRKLQIETRLKLLAKWDPKRYGDKITNEHTGGIKVVAVSEVDESI